MQILRTLLPYTQVGIALLLMVTILLQQKGAGAGALFGGGESTSYHTKRGLERVLFVLTIVLGVIFIALALLALKIR